MASEVFLTPNGRSPSPEIDKVSQKTGIRCEKHLHRAGRRGYSIELLSEYAGHLYGALRRAFVRNDCMERLRPARLCRVQRSMPVARSYWHHLPVPSGCSH